CHLTILPYASRLFSCSLLCTRSGAPRDLHSFPTRRSSDLRRAPVFQIADGVEDAPADLAIGRPGAIGAMLLKGADGYAEEARGFLGAQQARRQARKRVGHGSPPVGIGLPRGGSGLWRTMARDRRRVACRICAYALAAPPFGAVRGQ